MLVCLALLHVASGLNIQVEGDVAFELRLPHTKHGKSRFRGVWDDQDDQKDAKDELVFKVMQVRQNVTVAPVVECIYQYPETEQVNAILSQMMNELTKVFVRAEDFISGVETRRSRKRWGKSRFNARRQGVKVGVKTEINNTKISDANEGDFKIPEIKMVTPVRDRYKKGDTEMDSNNGDTEKYPGFNDNKQYSKITNIKKDSKLDDTNRYFMVGDSKTDSKNDAFETRDTKKGDIEKDNAKESDIKTDHNKKDSDGGVPRRWFNTRFKVVDKKRKAFFEAIYTNMTDEYRHFYNTTAERVDRTGRDPCQHQDEIKQIWIDLLEHSFETLNKAAQHTIEEYLKEQHMDPKSKVRMKLAEYLTMELGTVKASQLSMLCNKYQLCYSDLLK